MADHEHGHRICRLIDFVDHSVLSAARRPLAAQGGAQRLADTVRVVDEWPSDELENRGGYGFGECLGYRAGHAPGDLELVSHAPC